MLRVVSAPSAVRHRAASQFRGVLVARSASSVPAWATVDPEKPHMGIGKNLVGGQWGDAAATMDIIDPLNGQVMLTVPNTQEGEIAPFVARLKNCPRSGLHNPLKNVERYNKLGEVCALAAEEMRKPE